MIRFQQLKATNFKAHRALTVDFGEITRITGDNAKGKSSIPEMIPWLFYGVDTLGSKADPTPINYTFDQVKVELLFSIDDKPILLGRGLKSGKAQYWINEVPSKATEYDELVKSLFDKDLFLSLFNPSYFFTMHWESQRKMLLQYVPSPVNKDVFTEMSRTSPEQKPTDIKLNPQAEKLAELVKKHSLVDLEKIHKENKTAKDKAYIAAQSRTKTLEEQLQRYPANDIDVEAKQAEADRLRVDIKAVDEVVVSAGDKNRAYNELKAQIQSLQNQISASAAKWPAVRDEEIQDTCRTCKQPLDEKSVEAVKADKDKRKEEYQASHRALVEKRKELEAKLAGLQYIDVSEQIEKVRELERQLDQLLEVIRDHKQREQLLQQIEQARAAEADTLASRNDSVFILDAIKAFNAKEAEMMAAKVQALFTTLSLRLFKENKGDGEIKPDFEIEMDGKPYRKLSLSEGIRAGLELRDVLSEQSGIVAPCFVDNAESITKFKQPNGQLIICRVVANQELKIETDTTISPDEQLLEVDLEVVE